MHAELPFSVCNLESAAERERATGTDGVTARGASGTRREKACTPA